MDEARATKMDSDFAAGSWGTVGSCGTLWNTSAIAVRASTIIEEHV